MADERKDEDTVTNASTPANNRDLPPKENTRSWGRFQLIALLGSGGMGDVYKAYDPSLKRYIALKILRYEEPEKLKRFLREARAQAQVDHRNVCKIYESGEYGGHPFIAMQYIEGETLKELAKRLTQKEKLQIIKEVALGLHAAHNKGLIHRDVKSSNIMVSKTDEGDWKPYIMDFGIAREQEAPGLTSTGSVVGTPFYMSPELARGRIDGLDSRSDIYSLGVTLYELLSGMLPYPGDTPVEVLVQIIEKEPVPIRKLSPGLPVDIETIVMKCLDKDIDRRYSSAKELAEDIQRYLDGDPISARPTSITYRIQRKLIKHKISSVVIGVAASVIIILIGLWMHTRWAATKRAVIAQRLGKEVEKIESTIHYAHLLPLHNISREEKIIRERIEIIQKTMQKAGSMGWGPGHYAMGRGFMALQEYEKAREHLEKAWNSNYQTPEVAYDLGRVLGELYLKESEKVNRIENKELREVRKKEIEETFRQPAVDFLLKSRPIKNQSQDYIRSLIAFYEDDYQKSLKILQKAIKEAEKEAPWLYEAKILEGNIYLAISREISNYDDAMKKLPMAEQAYQHVIKLGESDIRGYVGLSRVLERKIMMTLYSKGGDLQPLVDNAIEQCRKALCINPEMADIYVMESSIYRWLGRWQIFRGRNPYQAFSQSEAAAKKALSIQYDNFEAYTIIGIVNRLKAEYQMEHGEDPRAAFQLAAWNFGKAIEFNPTYVMAYNGMGNVYLRRAEYNMIHGKELNASLELLERAITTFEKAISINSGVVDTHNGLAGAYWVKSTLLMFQGKDPRQSFKRASQYLKNAIEINPSFVHLYSNLGFVYMDKGRYEINSGFTPTKTLDKALRYFEKATEINPHGNELYTGLISVCCMRARYNYMMRKDCTPPLRQAEDYFEKGLKINPNVLLVYIRMAECYLFQGKYLILRHRSPLFMLKKADKLLKTAKAINSNYHEIYILEGLSILLKAEWAIGKNNPLPKFEKAEYALNKAKNLNPQNIEINFLKAWLNWKKAEWQVSLRQNQSAMGYISQGITSLDEALSINEKYAEAYVLRGVLLLLRSKIDSNDAHRLLDRKEGQLSLTKGFGINKNLKTLFGPYVTSE